MAETKFTKGPLEVREYPTQIGKCYRVGTVAMLDGGHGGAVLYDDSTSLNPHTEGEQKANAHLFASASDMYRTLNMVCPTLPHIGGSERSTFHMLKDI